jgi:catechol 2,3-dioxygenase-like lactoylglutathione lyase family enzyme
MPISDWPTDMPVVQVRVARPTGDLDAIIRFYGEGLGLKQIGSFRGHAGYDGVMFGLPGREYHLEFTQAEAAGAGEVGPPEVAAHGRTPTVREGANEPTKVKSFAPPSRDNLLVLYVPDRIAIDRIATRLADMGYPAVPPENPYWAEHGVTIEDPDGWRVVLMNTAGI